MPTLTKEQQEDALENFPELAESEDESEDEKIRKAIIDFLWEEKIFLQEAHSSVENNPKYRFVMDAIAWLEKQESIEEIVSRCKTSWYNEGKIQGQIEGLSDEEKYQQGWHDALEKQKEFGTFDVPKTPIKDAVEVTSRMQYISDDMKPIAEFVMGYANWDLHKDEWNQPTLTVPLFRVLDALIQRGKPYDECSQNIEKQGEQKPVVVDFKAKDWYVSEVDGQIHNMTYNPANKVEPKFKVGNWIIFNGFIIHIDEVVDGYYRTTTFDGIPNSYSWDIDNVARLWTIQDAKDGDVVVDKSDGTIGIFESIGHHPDGGSFNDPSYCFLHCRYDDGYFFADFEDGNIAGSYDVIPATKEQRDLLFAEMEEAGYEWDAEKKKLRKIKPIWGTVDLGLPSGTLWATMNVGATSETDYGLHFAWGDTQGYTFSQVGTGSGQKAFSWNDYVYGTENNLTKYNSTDGLTTLEHVDDVAYTFSDGQYVMPTKEQFEELIANTTSSWDSARSGYTFTSKVNGKSLFFPAAGGCFGGSVGYVESFSFYWASSLDSDSVKCSCGLSFDSEHMGVYRDYRCSGYSVRGVIKRKFSLYV